MSRALPVLLACALCACTPLRPLDAVDERDAGRRDGAAPDASAVDASPDARVDAGCEPGAPELCNGTDDDCDAATEDGAGDPRVGMPCDGADSDACTEGTYGTCTGGALACSDATEDSLEACGFVPADEDCDGTIDEAGAIGTRAVYADADGDGYGDDATLAMECERTGMTVTRGGDCDDTDPGVRPGRAEQCDARDDDCNGMIDDGDPCADACSTRTFEGHTYQFCEGAASWAAAQSQCAAWGYHLVEVETAPENNFLFSSASALGLGGMFSGVWIGLHYVAGSFVWVDGSTPTFLDWGSTEPNVDGCARLRVAMLDWADQECTANYDWICEAP